MEAYEEKSYDLTDHYGSVRRRRRSMSSRTREINKITMAIIRISVKLMLLALLILLLYEAVIRGYAFGSCAQSSEVLALRLPLKFGCNWRKIDRKGKCRKDSEST